MHPILHEALPLVTFGSGNLLVSLVLGGNVLQLFLQHYGQAVQVSLALAAVPARLALAL